MWQASSCNKTKHKNNMANPKDIPEIIHALINTSTPFIKVEIRGYKPETIEYIDRKSGAKASFSRVNVLAESIDPANAKQFKISLNVPPDAEIKGPKDSASLFKLGTDQPYPMGFKRGDLAIFVVASIMEDKGNISIQAKSWSLLS